MSLLKFKVDWYKFGETTATELTDVKSVSVRKGLDDKSNTVEVVLKNPLDYYDGTDVIHKYVDPTAGFSLKIAEGDILEIYADYKDDNTALTAADLITVADVVDVTVMSQQKKTDIKLSCVDRTYNLLNKLWTESYTTSTGLNAPKIIKNVIRNVNEAAETGRRWAFENDGAGTSGTEYTDGTGLFEVDARLVSEGGNIQSSRPDASDYPVKSMSKLFKPVYEWIEEMSQPEFTNTADEIELQTEPCPLKHIYYIDRNNKFHWFYPDNEQDYNIVANFDNSDALVRSAKLKFSTFDVVNVVYFNAGRDVNNAPVLGYYFDKSTKESTLKPKFMPYTDVCVNLREQEQNAGNITINEDKTVTVDVTSGTTSWGETYSSEGDYKDKFFTHAQNLGKNRAQKLTNKRGNPRWKGSISFRGVNVIPGEVVAYTDKTIGLESQLLRITKVTNQIDKNGWLTTIDVEEDEAIIQGD